MAHDNKFDKKQVLKESLHWNLKQAHESYRMKYRMHESNIECITFVIQLIGYCPNKGKYL